MISAPNCHMVWQNTYIQKEKANVTGLPAGLCVCLKLLQSCLTLCNPMDCSPPGSSVHGITGQKTGVGCYTLLQGIFPTQKLNPNLSWLLHWQAGSLPLVPPGKPYQLLFLGKEFISCCSNILATFPPIWNISKLNTEKNF